MSESTNIHSFPTKTDLSNPDVVQVLEEALERAKSGETKGILLLEQNGTQTSYSATGLKDRYHLVGYLQCAMHNLLAT
jgi:hypothetical protein